MAGTAISAFSAQPIRGGVCTSHFCFPCKNPRGVSEKVYSVINNPSRTATLENSPPFLSRARAVQSPISRWLSSRPLRACETRNGRGVAGQRNRRTERPESHTTHNHAGLAVCGGLSSTYYYLFPKATVMYPTQQRKYPPCVQPRICHPAIGQIDVLNNPRDPRIPPLRRRAVP